MSTPNFGLAHLWQQGDSIIHGVAVLLLMMSILAWTVILAKAWQHLRIRRASGALESFWAATSLPEAVALLAGRAPASPLTALAAKGLQASSHWEQQAGRPAALGSTLDRGEFLTRALRQCIGASTSRLEGGLTALASVGSTAPFIGLFGTVWSIYRALIGIGAAGQANLQQITGPVGEALIMTALGLAVAIPAVLAYNAYTRANRVLLAELDAFAHDLHAYLTTGARLQPVTTPQSPAAAKGEGSFIALRAKAGGA